MRWACLRPPSRSGGELLSKLKFNDLGDGKVSVSAQTPPGTRLDYKASLASREMGTEFSIFGTRYNATTLAKITATGLLKGSVSNSTVALAGVGSLGGNLIEYGAGSTSLEDFGNRTVENQDFWASTLADTIVSVGTGVLAAAAVSLLVAAAAVVLGVSAPLWVAVAATAGIGIGLGLVAESLGINKGLEGVINQGIDNIEKGVTDAVEAVKAWWPW
jgi:hypothetical protein